MGLAVEVLPVQPLVDDQCRQRGVREQHRAEHGLLGLQVLRRGHRSAAEAVALAARDGWCTHRTDESKRRVGRERMFCPLAAEIRRVARLRGFNDEGVRYGSVLT